MTTLHAFAAAATTFVERAAMAGIVAATLACSFAAAFCFAASFRAVRAVLGLPL